MSSLYYNHPFWPSPRAARIAKLLLKRHQMPPYLGWTFEQAWSEYWVGRPVKPEGRLTHDKALKVMADYLGLSVHEFLHIKPVDAILRLKLANTEAHAYRILGNTTLPAWWMSGLRMPCCVCLRQQTPPERGATVACERTAPAPAPAPATPAPAPAPATPAPAPAPAPAAPAPAPAPDPEDEDESDEEDEEESDEEDEEESDEEDESDEDESDKGDHLQRVWDEMVQRAKEKHDATLARLACRTAVASDGVARPPLGPPEPSTVVPVRQPPVKEQPPPGYVLWSEPDDPCSCRCLGRSCHCFPIMHDGAGRLWFVTGPGEVWRHPPSPCRETTAASTTQAPAPAAAPAPAPAPAAPLPAGAELIETLMEFLKEMNGIVTTGDQRYVTALVQRFKGRVV